MTAHDAAPPAAVRMHLSAILIAALALTKLLLHVVTNAVNPYGYFRDELYYIACGERLAFGYVDHPPAIALIARVVVSTAGDSIDAIRFPSALAGAALVVLTCLMVRELGGGVFAVLLAGIAATVAPVYLVAGGMLSTVPFDHLAWAIALFFLLRLLKTGDARYWLGIGIALGVGLETKHNAAFLAAAIAVATVTTQNRRYLRNRWLWAGTAAALLIALPHIIWQIDNGWPTLEFADEAAGGKNAQGGPIELPLLQILVMNPITLPIWATGLAWSLFRPAGQPYRMIGVVYVVLLLALLAQGGSRPDYLSPIYPPLLAMGAVAIERAGMFERRLWPRAAALALLIAGGAALAPIGLPVLRADDLRSYSETLGLDEQEAEVGKTSAIPQWFADRFGWEEMVATIGDVYAALPPDERMRTAIVTANYGEAGAIDFFGKKYGLVDALSGHNNYHMWGPRGYTGDTVITVGYSKERLDRYFGDVVLATVIPCSEFCTSEEQGLLIYIARDPIRPLDVLWDEFKHYG